MKYFKFKVIIQENWKYQKYSILKIHPQEFLRIKYTFEIVVWRPLSSARSPSAQFSSFWSFLYVSLTCISLRSHQAACSDSMFPFCQVFPYCWILLENSFEASSNVDIFRNTPCFAHPHLKILPSIQENRSWLSHF